MLAAGTGTRFGPATKQLALLDGRPLVTHVVATAAAAGLDPVVVVVGHDAQAVVAALPPSARPVHNPAYADGQASSLRAGIAALQDGTAAAAVVLLADEPTVTVDAVRTVVTLWRAGVDLVRTRYDDRSGHPVLFDRSVWPRLHAARGDTGARGILSSLGAAAAPHPGPAPRDVDEPADLDPPGGSHRGGRSP